MSSNPPQFAAVLPHAFAAGMTYHPIGLSDSRNRLRIKQTGKILLVGAVAMLVLVASAGFVMMSGVEVSERNSPGFMSQVSVMFDGNHVTASMEKPVPAKEIASHEESLQTYDRIPTNLWMEQVGLRDQLDLLGEY
mmetsp:Transcript_8592/g.16883  ORF Transcript_8592/g.16883 Transcript_8592/m.16883 type:complete len:136 (-) Transcript_8592:478-885(-)